MPLAALLLAALSAAPLAGAPLAGAPRATPDDSALRARIAERIAAVPGAVVGVAYRPLNGARGPRRDALDMGADVEFHAASTMKVPVMIELFRQVERGALSLDQPVLLVNQFGSIVDGSPYSVSPADDSDSLMYQRVGTRVPVRELIERMIVRSSNLATNAVIALADPARVTATARALGATRTRVLRGVEDGKAYERGLNNTTTAADLAALMSALATDRAASAASCAAMRDVLLRQEFNDEIPAGLPAGTPVAHKTGQITAVLHDAAIVYPRDGDPYVLVVLTGKIPDEKVARALIADISGIVWESRS
jgi:beta-lactamase class A